MLNKRKEKLTGPKLLNHVSWYVRTANTTKLYVTVNAACEIIKQPLLYSLNQFTAGKLECMGGAYQVVGYMGKLTGIAVSVEMMPVRDPKCTLLSTAVLISCLFRLGQ